MTHRPSEPAQPLAPLVLGLPVDIRRWAADLLQVVLLTAVVYVALTSLVAQPYEVEMHSMQPTLQPGDHILIDKITPHFDAYHRGDVVVFDAPKPLGADGIPYVKRVIGVAGDRVQLENGHVYVTSPGGVPIRLEEPYVADDFPTLPQGLAGTHAWTVPDGSVFVLGDNRGDSVDSRSFGPIPLESIIGRVWVRYLPLDEVRVLGTESTGLVASTSIHVW